MANWSEGPLLSRGLPSRGGPVLAGGTMETRTHVQSYRKAIKVQGPACMPRHPGRGTMTMSWRRHWENSEDAQRLRRQFNPMFHMRELREASSALIL